MGFTREGDVMRRGQGRGERGTRWNKKLVQNTLITQNNATKLLNNNNKIKNIKIRIIIIIISGGIGHKMSISFFMPASINS